MILDHVGIVVRSIDRAAATWVGALGYDRRTETVLNTRQRVLVAFFEAPGSLPIKLIEPSDERSPVHAFARRGGGLHHLCFRAVAVDAEVARLQAQGIRLIAGPEPGEAFEDEAIAFLYAGDGLNIELIDTDRRAGLLGDPSSRS